MLTLSFSGKGQIPTNQDCLGAIPVCQQIYSETLSPSGDGNYNNEINTSISCTAGELNSIWYTFTVDQSGNFGFLLTPNDINDDYDWSLFNITTASCEDIFSNQNLIVSCNAAGGGTCDGLTGATGGTIFDIQGAGCGVNPPTISNALTAFNDLIPVVAGNTYVLMVSNWTGSPNGYTLDFGLSTGIGIFDEQPPMLETLSGPVSCGGQDIDIEFSEYINCTTIDASNFQLTGPGGPYILSLDGNGCDNSANFENSFSLIIDPPISSMGTFTLSINSTGAFPLEDLCGNPIGQATADFDVDVPIPVSVNIGNDTSILCIGQTLLLNATIQGSTYVWQDGSTNPTFSVTQPGTYSVTLTNACGSGSDSIGVTYLLEPPQIELGPTQNLCGSETALLDASSPFSIYTWQDGSTDPTLTASLEGLYAVTVTNACGTTLDQVFINVIPPIDLDLGGDQSHCLGDFVLLDATNEDASYQWQDGSTNSSLTATQTGNYSVTVTTLCETQSDNALLTFIDETSPELGQDTFLCEGDTIFLDFSLPGSNNYIWQDGSTDPIYPVTLGGEYTARVTTQCNSFDDVIFIYFIPLISYDLGRDTFLCEAQYWLDASTAGPASYEWQDGSKEPYFIADAPGEYRVSVFNECELISDTIQIKECEFCDMYYPTVFSPNFDGINDEFRPFSECPPQPFLLRIFDRWGALVFESEDPEAGWDGTFHGKPVSAGAYVWTLEYTVVENNLARAVSSGGSVVVIR